MGEYMGGCRFKVEQVDNGWYIEFHPKLDFNPDLDRKLHTQSRMQKHCAGPDIADLMEVLHELLYRSLHPIVQAEEPTASQPEPE